MINFRCPKCNDELSVPDSVSGQTETCPSCGNITVVPEKAVLKPDNPLGSTEGRERNNAISGIAIAVSIFAAILALAGLGYFLHTRTPDPEPASKKHHVPLSMTNKLGTMELHIRHCKYKIMAYELALLQQKNRLGELSSDESTRMLNYRDDITNYFKDSAKGIIKEAEEFGTLPEGAGIVKEAILRHRITRHLAQENERLKKCKEDRDQMKERIKVYQAKGYDPLTEKPPEERAKP